MNTSAPSTTTLPAYGVGERVTLALLGGVLVPLCGWLVFVVARHRLRYRDSLRSRAYLFYQVLAGVLLGQFVCHTWVGLGASAWDVKYMFLFALFGMNALHTAELVGRLWNTNRNYMGPADDDHLEDEEAALDRERMEEQTMVLSANVASAEAAQTRWRMLDDAKRMRKRQWMLGLVLLVFAIIGVMDGLLLVYRNPRDDTQMVLTVLAFYLNGFSMTVSVYGAALHAKWHVAEVKRVRWWVALTLLWAAVLLGSAAPAISGIVSVEAAQQVIGHRAFLAFYGVASGCVLGLWRYYGACKTDTTDRRELYGGELAYWLATAQAALTGFWL